LLGHRQFPSPKWSYGIKPCGNGQNSSCSGPFPQSMDGRLWHPAVQPRSGEMISKAWMRKQRQNKDSFYQGSPSMR
jgi:hypothetical protein